MILPTSNRDYLILALSFSLLTVPSVAFADTGDVWMVATVKSYHWNRPTTNNEKNYGAGIEYGINKDWTLSAGYYENSHYRTSIYLGAPYNVASLGPLTFRLGPGIITGYKKTGGAPIPVVVPDLSVEFKHIGINLMIHNQVFGLQLKVRLPN